LTNNANIPPSLVSPLASTLAALLFTAALSTFVIGTLPPFWETNDDLGMAMILDGYGLAAHPSPTLIYSNILYGQALTALPQIGDISRYGLASISLTLLAAFLIFRALCLSTPNYLTTAAVTALIFVFPLAFPQFTTLSGLLSLAGILHVYTYLQREGMINLLIAGAALFIGYLIRPHAFYLVFLISAVLLPWKHVLSDIRLRLLATVLIVLCAAAMLADWRAYRSPDWQTFSEVNVLRAAFTDFDVARHFARRPELLQGTNYTPNDILLLENWFLADPSIVNATGLEALLSQVELSSLMQANIGKAWGWVAALSNDPLRYLVVASVLAGLLARNWVRFGLAWVALIVILIGLGLTGRPPVTRVIYAPVASLLCLAAHQMPRAWQQWLLVGVMALLATASLAVIVESHRRHMQLHEQATNEMASIDKSKLYIVWGGSLPLQSMYPVLGSLRASREFRWYGMGVGSPAPFAMAHWKDTPGGLPARLAKGEPVPFFAPRHLITYLAKYCEERHFSQLRIIEEQRFALGDIFTVTCRR
jgi:hypothetical protein